ncbi:CHAT domain-containing protein [Alloyangia pacifica]|uniref:CHAT domain-containing protein n=1 Tax=Alloyangia pacifica TaxID=311180 RepID=UPI001CD6B895|nr:CHAT domain-containing protein [Alloyangia pacifica]MCA0996844.1 CHAT domain-containing protein [Alloyangia pacifica]
MIKSKSGDLFGGAILDIRKGKEDNVEHFIIDLIRCDGYRATFISASSAFVVAKVSKFQATLESFSKFSQDWDAQSKFVQEGALEELRRASKKLTAAIFYKVEEIINGRRQKTSEGVQEKFLDLIAAQNIFDLSTNVHADELVIPWNLLSFCRDGELFWLGERIYVAPLTQWLGGSEAFAKRFASSGYPKIAGYAEYNRLESARKSENESSRLQKEEFWILEKFFGGAQRIDVLRALTSSTLDSVEIGIVQKWLSQPRHMYHIKSHISAQEDPEQNGLVYVVHLDHEAWMYDTVIDPDCMVFQHGVFLNMCYASGIPRNSRISLAERFIECGAAAVCSTTGPVSDSFSRMFAAHVYDVSAKKQLSLREAVKESRKKLFSDVGHPLPLLYIYQGDPTFTL